MQYIIVESFLDQVQDYYGPFPSQCQAYTYAESLRLDLKHGVTYRVSKLRAPAYMPEQIHSA